MVPGGQVNLVDLVPVIGAYSPIVGQPGHTTISGAYKTFSSVHEPTLKSGGDAKISSEATHSSKSRNFGEGSPDFNEAKCEKNVRLSEETMRRPVERARG